MSYPRHFAVIAFDLLAALAPLGMMSRVQAVSVSTCVRNTAPVQYHPVLNMARTWLGLGLVVVCSPTILIDIETGDC